MRWVSLLFAAIALRDAPAGWDLIDGFDRYPDGPLATDAAPWEATGPADAFLVEADPTRPGGRVLLVAGPAEGDAAELRHKTFAPLPSGNATATLFCRMQYTGAPGQRAFVHLILARANDKELPARAYDWRLSLAGQIPKLAITRTERHGSRDLISEFAPDTWVNVWSVIRSGKGRQDIYVAADGTPTAGADHLLARDVPLRSSSALAILRIRSDASNRPAKVRIDDVWLDRSGENLANPCVAARDSKAR